MKHQKAIIELLQSIKDGSLGALNSQQRAKYKEFARSFIRSVARTECADKLTNMAVNYDIFSTRWARNNADLLIALIEAMEEVESDLEQIRREKINQRIAPLLAHKEKI